MQVASTNVNYKAKRHQIINGTLNTNQLRLQSLLPFFFFFFFFSVDLTARI